MTTNLNLHSIQERLAAIEPFVGNTPLYPLKKIFPKKNVNIFAKLEWQNMGGSVKARPAFNIIKQAFEDGLLHQGKTLLDASSGNTGIAYATFCAQAGIKLKLCIPENASQERKDLFNYLGTDIVYTSPFESTDGAQRVARELRDANPDKYYYADQYSNENNWKAHYNTTAPELWEQTQGHITHFVAGLGTTGTFTGTGTRLKELKSDIELVGLQPETALHGMEGWKHLETAHVPEIYNNQLADRIETVDTMAVFDLLKETARVEGLILSPSSAANLLGTIKIAEQIDEGTIVTVFPDDSSKYKTAINQIFNA